VGIAEFKGLNFEQFLMFRTTVLPSCSGWSARRSHLTFLCPDYKDTTILRNTFNPRWPGILGL